MSADSDRMRANAADMIRRRGKSISYVTVTPGTRNTATGTSTPTETVKAIKGVVTDARLDQIGKGGCVAGDRFVMVASLDIESPTPGHFLTMDSVRWTIVSVVSTYYEEATVIHELMARRA